MADTAFEEKLGKAWSAVWDIELFTYALIFITSFLASLLVFLVFGVQLYLALVPAIALVGFAYIRDRRAADPLRTIEENNAALKDRLSAAYDNRGKENFIVKDLIGEVTYDLENMRTDVFLDLGRTGLYVGISIVIVFILLSLMLFDPFGFGMSGLFGGGSGGGGQSGSQGQGSGSGSGSGSDEAGDSPSTQDVSTGLGASQDIYGDVSIARIEGNDMQLEIHPEYGEQGDFGSEESERQGRINEIKDGFVQAVAAESYSESIPVEMEEIVRGYFERISNE